MGDPDLARDRGALSDVGAGQGIAETGLDAVDDPFRIPPPPVEARNPRWSKESEEFLKEHKECEACGQGSEVVHHKYPVHAYPHLEMDQVYWRAMCHKCHFTIGHLCNWQIWNVMVDEMTALARSAKYLLKWLRNANPK